MQFEGEDTIELKGLEKLLKALKQKPPVARIGILGGKVARGNGPSNAEIGAAHEYGAPARGLPMRSFLRYPISTFLGKEMEKRGAISEATTKAVLKEGTVVPWLKQVMVLAENIVKGAFASNGYGSWASWKDPNYENNTGMVLVDSTQLRDSITWDVKE